MKVFVSNLLFSFNEDDLKLLFSPYGEVVSCTITRDKFDGASKGVGFIEMSNGNEAMEAIAMLDGKLVKGRPIAVSIARERTRPSYERRSFY
jgi:RNA recognition motif-containing protein